MCRSPTSGRGSGRPPGGTPAAWRAQPMACWPLDQRLDLVHAEIVEQVAQQGAAGLGHIAFALMLRQDQPADIDALFAQIAVVIVDHADHLAALALLDRPYHVLTGPVDEMP